MNYSGFWTYRGSNDVIFVVESGENWIINNFCKFCRVEMKNGNHRKLVYMYNRKGDAFHVDLDWSKLTCVAVQTKKTLEGRKKSRTNLHPKFFFELDYIKRTDLYKFFEQRNYQKQLEDMDAYWDTEKVGHPNVVADEETSFDEIVVQGGIFNGVDALVPSRLPENKNIYVVTDDYKSTFDGSSRKRKRNDV